MELPIRRLGNWLLCLLARAPSEGARQRIVLAVLRRARSILLRLGDPVVTYDAGTTRLAIPLSHELPFVRKRSPDYALDLGRIAALIAAKYPNCTFIDVGANVGDTVAVLRAAATVPVLCVEGSDRFFDLLKRNMRGTPDIVLEKRLVGGRTGRRRANLLEREGTGTLRESPEAAEISVESLERILARQPRFAQSKLLKIDTDGMDLEVLNGALDFVAVARPVVFFELESYFAALSTVEPLSLFASMSSAGYRHVIAFEDSGRYLLAGRMEDTLLLEDLLHFGSRVQRYLNLCAFHTDDSDLFEMARAREIELAQNALRLRTDPTHFGAGL